MMKSILTVVVVYKVDYHATNVWQTLLSHEKEARVVLYDNSPKPINAQYAEEGKVYYHHDPLNGGVSAAYNYGAQLGRDMADVEALVLLDEDTCFPADYLQLAAQQLSEQPSCSLFVPQVRYQGDQPFSPAMRHGRRRGVSLSPGHYSLTDYLPVNTGVCIRLTAFDKTGGYNPDIRLDFADFDFFSRLCEYEPEFTLLDAVAQQSFSNEETCADRLWPRFRLFIEGGKAARKNSLISAMVRRDVICHTLALTRRTHRLRFILYWLRNI